jgi:hypothetical protein
MVLVNTKTPFWATAARPVLRLQWQLDAIKHEVDRKRNHQAR